jgi:hypothetical protein
VSARHVLARVQWLAERDGGRKAPPTGPRYWAVARFPEAKRSPPSMAWSVVVDLLEHTPTEGVGHVNLSFLVGDAAPQELLLAGATFELMEGPHVVAHGVVLEDVT